MQRADLEAEVGRLLGDPNNTRWSTSVIDLRLDAAQLDVQKWTNAVKTTTSYTPTANASGVTVGDTVIDILRATYTLPDGTVRIEGAGFNPINRYQLDFERPNWPNEDPGEPVLWTFDASTKQIILIPAPDAAHAAVAGALKALEVRQPTALSTGSSTSVPFDSNALMVPYHRALIYWTVSECLKDNQDSDSLSKAKYFRSNDLDKPGEYEKEIRQILMKFDVPEGIPAKVQWKSTGGRLGSPGQLSKSNPLGFS
jgi:hypothetical protein